MAKAADIPSYVPAQYDQWISTASSETGLPATVVAAQINDESGFNPDALSSAGAEGIAQFLPSTYAGEGGTGSEFVADNELKPYIKLTRQNLKWSGGNVEQALAAYNAGEGNWQAGLGYADTILSNAQQGSNLSVTPPDVNVGGSSGTSGGSSTGTGGGIGWGPFSLSYDTLERFGLIVLGGLFIIVGIWTLAGKQTIKLAGTAVGAAAKAP